jgi:hypothetical protein
LRGKKEAFSCISPTVAQLRRRSYHPDEYDAVAKAATVGELAFEHKLYKSPRHSIFLLRALIGLDGIMKGLGVKMNYCELFRECVRSAAQAAGA